MPGAPCIQLLSVRSYSPFLPDMCMHAHIQLLKSPYNNNNNNSKT